VIKVQEQDFDVGAEIDALVTGNTQIGGVASFTGYVRDLNNDAAVSAITLEHYPGMTEAKLEEIEQEAHRRWNLDGTLIIHRYGRLEPGDRIVLVIAASAHRQEAFDAAMFLMDWLKTRAPFWKLEATDDGEQWVEARSSDDYAADKWSESD
jgi:molybdopterin synthase catalytic subunit